jgi:4'-phosphopantetheinyl transferase
MARMTPENSYGLPKPDDRTVDVWVIPVRASEAVVSKFKAVLSQDELARATRLRFEHLRRSFIVAHGTQRVLLSRYLKVAPAEIQFTYSAKGKPNISGTSNIRFNLSHSGDFVLLAVTLNCDVGVDLEQMRPLPDLANIADRYFSREETSELMSLPPEQHERAFFACWTRKEAYIKAVGEGLSTPLDSFHVTLLPDAPARMIHLGGGTGAAEAWNIVNIDLGHPQYMAALAYHEAPRPLHVIRVSDAGDLLEGEAG